MSNAICATLWLVVVSARAPSRIRQRVRYVIGGEPRKCRKRSPSTVRERPVSRASSASVARAGGRVFRQNYGPTTRAFATLDAAQQEALRTELTALWSLHNESQDPLRTIVNAEYLEVVGKTRTASELRQSQ